MSLLAAASLAVSSIAVQIVAPNEYAGSPGPDSSWKPFGWIPDTLRIQQVFRANQFGGVSGRITKIAYRVDEVVGSAFGPVNVDMRIALSHVTFGPNGHDMNFFNNPGPDNTVVWNGVMALSSSGSGFDIVLDVNDTFTYNGTSNLLLDLWVITGGPGVIPQLDATQGGHPNTSLIWGWGGGQFGTNLGDNGLVTQFTIVPEPVTFAVLGLGIVPLLRRRRR